MRDEPWGPDDAFLSRLKSGDEAAFGLLVDTLHARLVALARTFTRSSSLAEDVVQECWLAVIRGLPGFEGRASLRTWVFSILIRRARTLAAREARRPESGASLDGAEVEWQPGFGRIGLWEKAPRPWEAASAEAELEAAETLALVGRTLDGLPEAQRQVVFLRDVEGLSGEEVCNILSLSETNQRVLLHRGRAAVRRALDRHFRAGDPPAAPVGGPVPAGGKRPNDGMPGSN